MTARYNYKPVDWLIFLQKTDEALKALCRVDIFKATGRGGQKKNKTSNAIRLNLAHLMVTYTASRSQAENLRGALHKLRLAIATDLHDGFEARGTNAEYPPELKSYIQGGMIHINAKNPIFPIFIGFCVIALFHALKEKIIKTFNNENIMKTKHIPIGTKYSKE